MSVSPLPMVRMMRHPPVYVPSAIAVPEMSTTHHGGAESWASAPVEMRARVMTPMVFCASLVPWASATSDAEPTCPRRNPRRAWSGAVRRVMTYAK